MSSTSNKCSAVCALGKKSCNTQARIHEVSYVWTINNFEFHEAEGSFLHSPEFSADSNDQIKWVLLLKPNGDLISDTKDTISFYVEFSLNSAAEKVYAKHNSFVWDSQHKKISISKGVVHEYLRKDKFRSWGRRAFLKKDDNFRNNLLINGQLTIICDIYFSTVLDAISNTSHECKTALPYSNAPDDDLLENLGQLLEHRDLADVVLSVGGQDYPAHKTILAARSPVFAAMFKHDTMKENVQNRIEIEDMNVEVIGDFLKYIYTGKYENLRNKAQDLLAASDKYQLNGLKMVCAEELYRTLSVENAAKILALADMHCVEELKSEVINFIVSESTEVFETESWKKKLGSNFPLVNEVCLALAQRLNKSQKKTD
ncbi:speckle-type POZ protein-like [Planococcus citri]|uniref:speckle-type POZ protein-like n=1 Tax=Planococcus citri TaxID=170843 RepID=UPI0031F9A78F